MKSKTASSKLWLTSGRLCFLFPSKQEAKAHRSKPVLLCCLLLFMGPTYLLVICLLLLLGKSKKEK